MFADAFGLPRVTRQIPYRIAYAGGFVMEMQGRLLGQVRPPRITRYGAWLLGRYLAYSTEKARTRLGWQPAFSYRESIEPARSDGFAKTSRQTCLPASVPHNLWTKADSQKTR